MGEEARPTRLNDSNARRSTGEVPRLSPEILARALDVGEGRVELGGEPIATESFLDRGFAGVLAHVWRQRRTGTLRVESDEVVTTIYVREGTPIYAEGGTASDTLGRVLLRRRRITEEQFAKVISRMTERISNNENVRFGDVLVELAILRPDEVAEALKLQSREKLMTCFRWPELRAAFEDGQAVPPDGCRFPSQVPALIRDGVLEGYDPARVQSILKPHLGKFPMLRDGVAATAERIAATASEQRFLASITGKQPLGAVHQSSPIDSVVAGQLLAVLLVLESMTLHASEASAASRPKAPSNKPAPAASPPSGGKPAAPVAPPAAPQKPQKPTAAAEDPAAKERRFQAELVFVRAKGIVTQGRLEAALPLLKRAAEMDPTSIELELHYAYVEYLMCRDPTRHSALAARVKDLAQTASRKDPPLAKAQTVLGHFAKTANDFDGAERYFEAALRLDPNDMEAARELRLLKNRKSSKW